ncbi:MAG: hypothetical protein COU07_03470 [Candidatus Harrisonbacteria bacterium CG10_big_fil_rev_8_21_14_0_10_40_38]|uniref:Uncharacterized protein n=1 Tax=Candidatus Harrisonbacteria bacterium CG10_big_fil_rev_8_21_14_0_10_40_38 TaxID=1974583 RepID=A0A2H0URA8_9BACT|nr:MAG: hypothetical protein COU07_03470 [Candidatus Harrisonbacteria bacterium CG10_big_fil_rev_8_21_14_0_10_40_38]
MDQNNQNPGGVGAPPSSEVGIRTMGSDTNSVQRGDAAPMPESVLPPQSEKEAFFKPETQSTMPSSNNGSTGAEVGSQPEGNKGGKKWLFWVVFGVVIIGVGLLGYFVVGPLLFPETAVVESPKPTPTEQAMVHNTYLLGQSDASSEVRLSNILSATISTNLQAISVTKLPSGSLQEIVVKDSAGSQVPWSSYLSAYLPALAADQIKNWFENDFTAFLYYTDDGVWPGYIAKVKNGVNIDEVKSNMNAMESADLSGFYLANPGNGQDFKSGQLNSFQTRYKVFSEKGASFNYAFVNNYLVISTSFDGLKKAVTLLGY